MLELELCDLVQPGIVNNKTMILINYLHTTIVVCCRLGGCW